MGKQILGDDTPLEEMMWQLFEDFREEMSLGTIYDPNVAMNAARAGNLPLPAKVVNKLVIIESTEASDIWESQITLAPTVMPTPQGPIEVAIQQVVFNGWRHSK